MANLDYIGKPEDTGRKCQECGRPIWVQKQEYFGSEIWVTLDCKCVKDAREAKRKVALEKGPDLIRDRHRIFCGLLKRQRGQTLDSFIPQSGQKEAYEQVKVFADDFSHGKNDGTGLFIVGPVGCGKSHLAASVINYQIDQKVIEERDAIDAWERRGMMLEAPKRPQAKNMYTGTVALLEEIRQAYNDGGECAQDVTDKYCRAKLLVLDDVGTEKMTEWAEERLFEIIDYRYNEILPTVITTNLTPDAMKVAVGDRIYDRIREMCKLVTMTAKSQRKTA